MMTGCEDCPRLCRADRITRLGFCGVGEKARVVKTISPFLYEEPCLGELSAVFFGGCNLGCSYCQNYEISRAACGKEYSDGELAELFDGTVGALDLVTPTPHARAIARALGLCKTRHDVIYNTSGYETEEAIRRASEYTSVFLTDIKYVSEDIAKRFSAAPDYFYHAARAVKLMRKTKDVWEQSDGADILRRGLIVRHLVLPGCASDSIKILDFIAGELGTDTVISLMSQFTPNGAGEPSSRLKKIEYKLVAEHALKLGFTKGYFQSFESADSSFTPNFSD